jgi:hypothetical protein
VKNKKIKQNYIHDKQKEMASSVFFPRCNLFGRVYAYTHSTGAELDQNINEGIIHANNIVTILVYFAR